MDYFYYSATSNANDEVLNKFIEEEKKDKLSYTINDLEKEIKNILNSNFKVNFTSGSTEANNLAIKGVLNNYETGHIITTKLEHSSVI